MAKKQNFPHMHPRISLQPLPLFLVLQTGLNRDYVSYILHKITLLLTRQFRYKYIFLEDFIIEYTYIPQLMKTY